MKFISGQQALNIPCSLETCGDWHTSALQWDKLDLKESEGSIFGEYGLEVCKSVPKHRGQEFYVADTIRASLELMIEDRLSVVQGLREDFICNEKYTQELFSKVIHLKSLPHWNKIDSFMKREYTFDWVRFRDDK